jgi:VIT1/CCC1 family predicted Fe2+/Mn2+ transporter
MSDIEKGHVIAFARKSNISEAQLMRPSWRAKTLNMIGKIFGYDYVLGTLKELALIYITKGLPEQQACQMAADKMKDKHLAHEVLVREELGINPDELKGSALEAAIYSFILFSIGAVIPVLPFIFTGGMKAVLISVMVSAAGLFVIGAAITLFTGRNVLYSGLRQVLFGIVAAAITFGIGKLIGVSIT